MSLQTYEFDTGEETAWVVAHCAAHADAHAAAQGWIRPGHVRFGALRTAFLCECDIDAMLDKSGKPVDPVFGGANA